MWTLLYFFFDLNCTVPNQFWLLLKSTLITKTCNFLWRNAEDVNFFLQKCLTFFRVYSKAYSRDASSTLFQLGVPKHARRFAARTRLAYPTRPTVSVLLKPRMAVIWEFNNEEGAVCILFCFIGLRSPSMSGRLCSFLYTSLSIAAAAARTVDGQDTKSLAFVLVLRWWKMMLRVNWNKLI